MAFSSKGPYQSAVRPKLGRIAIRTLGSFLHPPPSYSSLFLSSTLLINHKIHSKHLWTLLPPKMAKSFLILVLPSSIIGLHYKHLASICGYDTSKILLMGVIKESKNVRTLVWQPSQEKYQGTRPLINFPVP